MLHTCFLRFGAFLAFALICCSISFAAQRNGEDAAPLSLTAAVELALTSHPALAAATSDVEAAKAGISVAESLASPEVLVVPAGTIDEGKVLVEQTVEIGGKWAARVRGARAASDQATWDREATRQEVILQVRTAYTDALEARALLQLAEEAVALVRQVAQAAERAYDLGDVPRSHVVRARVEQAQVEQGLATTHAALQRKKAGLNTAIGRRAETPFSLNGSLEFTPVDVQAEDALQQALERRPEIRAAAAGAERAHHELKVAERDLYPDLVLAGRLSEFGGGDADEAGLALTLPFLDWGQRKAEIRGARSVSASQRALQQQVANQVSSEVEEAVLSLAAARQRVEAYQPSLLADAEELMSMAQWGYEQGAMTYLEVVDARRAFTEVQGAYYRALADHQRSLAALARAVGDPNVIALPGGN